MSRFCARRKARLPRRRYRCPALLWMLCLLAGLPTAARAAEQAVVPGEALVRFRDDVDPARAGEAIASVGASAQYLPDIHLHRVRLRPGVTLEQALVRLWQSQGVLYVAPNHIVHLLSTPNDTYYQSDQYGPAIVRADLAWGLWNPQASITIAVIDTGVDGAHPDLANKILRDAQGIVGYNVFVYDSTLHRYGKRDAALDDYGHGTECAGIAAAQVNNGIGVAGIAGWDGLPGATDTSTKIMPVKVLDSNGSGTDAGVADGILWAVDHGARVLSLSIGGGDYSYPINSAVQYAWDHGVVVAAAAGNGAVDGPLFPAACLNAIAVAATENTDTLTWFSSYGDWVPVAAPGQYIMTTLMGGGYTKEDSGTSMSTPHVAGEAALLLAQNPSLTNYEARNLITGNVDPYTPYASHLLAPGGGRINVYNALRAAFTPPPPNPTKAYLFAAEDAYVESGANAAKNFGDASTLIVRNASDGVRDVIYMKLDLTGLTTPPSSAKLLLTQDGAYTTPAGSQVTFTVYDIQNTSWIEKQMDTVSGVTWNTAPGLNPTTGASTGTRVLTQTVTLNPGVDVALDLTAYVAAHPGQIVTLQILSQTTSAATLAFYSREHNTRTPAVELMLNPAKVNVAGKVTLQACVNGAQPVAFAFRPVGGGTPFTRTQTLGAGGAFTLKDIPAGHYSLAVKGSKWLQKVVPVNATAGSVSVNVTLLPGDVNGDNRVDIADLGLFADAFNTTPSDSGWNTGADLNCDNRVDIADLSLLADTFNTAGDP